MGVERDGNPIDTDTREIEPAPGAESSAKGSALVVEDHPLYRDALVQLLRILVGEANVAQASSAEQGVRLAANMRDLRVVLLDVGLPGLSGTEAVFAIRQACPNAMLIVVSASEDRREATAALRAGACLFISKTISTTTLADIVRSALAGETPKQQMWIAPSGDATFLDESLPALTARQRQILLLLIDGYGNKEIGLRLGLAEVTVKMHVSSIYRLLGVSNRTQAVRAAYRMGICETETASAPQPP